MNKVLLFVFLSLLGQLCLADEALTQKAVTADVVITTRFGEIKIRLLPDLAPNHVENFVKLTEQGFYNGTLFHRIIPGFMIQGGDPNTKGGDKSRYGQGGPGYTIDAEFSDWPHLRGVVSMARASDPNSAGSQFFIVVKRSRFLDNEYTIFGKVISGMAVVDLIVAQGRDRNDVPLKRIPMKVRLEPRKQSSN